MRRTSFVRAVAAVTALLVPAACGGGGDSGRTTEPRATDTPATQVTTRPTEDQHPTSGPATTAESTVPQDDVLADLQLGQQALHTVLVDDRWQATAAVEVTNASSGWIGDIEWTATLVGADGAVIEEAKYQRIDLIGPGVTSWGVPQFYLDAGGPEPTEFRITLEGARRLTDLDAASDAPIPLADLALSLVSAKAYVDVNETTHLEGLIANAADVRLTTVGYHCGAYRDSTLIAGAFGYIAELAGNGRSGFDTTSGLGNLDPLPDDVRCVATPVNLSTYEPGVVGSGLESDVGFSYHPGGLDPRVHDTSVGMTVTNPRDETAFGVTLQADLYAEDGSFMHVALTDVPYVLPGQTFYAGAWPVISKDSPPPASIEMHVYVEKWGDGTVAEIGSLGPIDLTAFSFTVTDAQYVLVNGSGEIHGSITNDSAQPVELARVSCTLMSGGRPVAGNGWTVFDPLLVGEAVPFEIIMGYTAPIDHDAVECTVHLAANSTVG